MQRKDTITEKIKTKKLTIAIVLAIFILCCVLLEYTPLMKVYWLKAIIERISQNKWNIWFICIVLIVLHYVEKKMFLEKNETFLQEGEKNND